MLLRVFSYFRTELGSFGVLGGYADYGEGFVDDEALGPCFISPAG